MSSTFESTPTGETSLFQDAEEKEFVIKNAETSQQVVVSEALVPPLPAVPPAVTAGQKRKSETQLTNPTNATKQKNNATPSKSTGGKSGSKLPMSKGRLFQVCHKIRRISLLYLIQSQPLVIEMLQKKLYSTFISTRNPS